MPGADQYWWAFSELDGDRVVVVGSRVWHSRISSLAIAQMAEWLWPGDFEEQMRFRRVIREMDVALLETRNVDPDAPAVSSRPMTAELFDAIFGVKAPAARAMQAAREDASATRREERTTAIADGTFPTGATPS